MKRTPLRRRSPRQQRGDAVLADVRREVFDRDGWECQAAGIVLAVACAGRLHAHHMLARSQGGGHTADNLIALCGAHHDWCHGHPEQARRLGFIRRAAR